MESVDLELPRPATVREAVTMLLDGLEDETLSALRATDEADLIDHHFGLGRIIRNLFGLPGENPALMADTRSDNADEASMVIIRALWRQLRLH